MVHTWQSDHLQKLEISNLEAGDVAVCGAFAKHAPILAELDEDRIGFVAPLGSRSDLEWLLRGLHLYPNIRHLVICGGDLRVTGEALLALWRNGVDDSGRLSDSRGSLSAGLEATSVDALRSYVKVWDWREKPLSEVATGILDLPALPRERGPKSLPDPVIPERKVFLSRKTSFPIFSSDVGDSWLQLLNLAMRIGTEKRSAEGERLAEALNAVVTIGLPALAEETEENEERAEFPAFLDFNRDDFDRYYRRFEAPPSSDDAGPRHVYEERLHDWDGIDQLEALCDRLKKSPDTRSGTVIFLGPNDLSNPKVAPDLISATFNAVDQRIFASFVLRSADLYTDWPLQAMALVRLQREVAGRLGLEVGPATFVIHSAHLYDRDWDRALRVLDESFKRPLPLQVDHSGIFLFGNDGGQARAMLLDHDAGTIFWEEAFNDPEELSWYITDVMPWLLPQHIRYVGQECSTLMRAIREGECYEQG
jgi:thymidylate synthase